MPILVISAHPDDETLGCGGMMLKHVAEGQILYWLIVTQAYEPVWKPETIAAKAIEVENVAKAYGVTKVFKLGLPAGRLDTLPQVDMINAIRTVVDQVRPRIVYMVHGGDVHTDHHAVFTAAMSVLKPFYMNKLGVKKVLSYETLSSTDAAPVSSNRLFVPNVFSDIGKYLERKIEIMNLYASEVHAEPMPRSPSAIRAQARVRGATISVEAAEAFVLVREIV